MTEDVKNENTVESQEIAKKESTKDENFEKLRKKLEALEAEKERQREVIDRQSSMLSKLESAFSSKQEEDYDDDPDDFVSRKQLSQWEKKLLQEAEKIAERKYQQTYEERLRSRYHDYDEVVNASSVKQLEEQDPEYAQLVAEVGDDYKRREMAYKRIKKIQNNQKSSQNIADENAKKNYYYTPFGGGSPSHTDAIEFDVSNPEARKAAYAKLKAAQKRGF